MRRQQKYLLLVVIVLVSARVAPAQRYWQRLDVSLNAGYSTFKMTDLKELQQEYLSYLPVEGRITNSFPGYLNYSIDAVFYDSTYYVGVVLGHTSTGGRINYTDYSGSVTSDQLVRMTYSGLVIAKRIASTSVGNIFIGTTLTSYFNDVKITYSEVVLGEESSTNISLESLNIALGPFVQLHKRLGRFFVKVSAGYELHLGTDLYYEGNSEFTFQSSSSGETYKVNADGLRVGVGIGYALLTRRPTE